jgi:outer membrane protein
MFKAHPTPVKRFWPVLTLMGTLVCASLPAAASVSLDDAFRATVERNEDAASQNENVIQAEERYRQAKAALFPAITGIASVARQDTPPAGTGSAISPAEQRTLRINAIQPIFRGFREWAGIRQQAVLSESAKLNRETALRQLYVDVSAAYYQALLAAQDLSDLTKELEANEQRKSELLRFRGLGRSRSTEVLSSEAILASLEAQIEQAKSALENSRTTFTLLTGLPADSVLTDTETYPAKLAPIDTFLARIELRPDVRSLAKTVESTDESISIARGGHLPSIDLSGNYYFARPGVLADVKWDVMLSLTLPIFQGGAISSQVTQAASIHKQAELALSKGRRVAREEIETLYAAVTSERIQVQKWKKSVEAANKSYQAQLRDYRLGIVNNLEVLQELTSAQTAQRSLDRAEIQYRTDYIRLLSASAERPSTFMAQEGPKK